MLSLGDIVCSIWGYEQSNVNFYKVVKTTPSGKSVYLRKLRKSSENIGYGQANVKPVNEFADDVIIRRKVSGIFVHISSHEVAKKYDGENILETSYY